MSVPAWVIEELIVAAPIAIGLAVVVADILHRPASSDDDTGEDNDNDRDGREADQLTTDAGAG